MIVRVASRRSHALRCAFCYGSAEGTRACPECGTLLHDDCRPLSGGCSTLACPERAASARRPQRSDRLAVVVIAAAVLATLHWATVTPLLRLVPVEVTDRIPR